MIYFCISISIILLIIILSATNNARYKKYINENSITYKKLKELNSKYHFYPMVKFDMDYTYDNENYYNDISCEDYLIYNLQFNYRDVLSQIDKVNKNIELQKKYLLEIKEINNIGSYEKPTKWLSEKKLIKLEKKICNENVIKPVTNFTISIILSYSTINGRKFRHKLDVFDSNDVKKIINCLGHKRGNYYLDKGIWNSICKVERGKVSNKMRFSIYERDGYRCRICGLSERNANLEIDHIIPIAKGGKSTYNNLQTLCHNCNVNKGDYLPYGNKKVHNK